jgi:hypothetical protein
VATARRRVTSRPSLRWGSFLVACAAFGCGAAASSARHGPVALDAPLTESIRRVPATIDVSGLWATGIGEEPVVQRIVVRPECNSSPASWILQQNGDTLRSWVMTASYSKGTAAAPPQTSASPTMGFVSGDRIIILAAGAHYDLRYDSTSAHLRGTLNGGAFWAVRQIIVRRESCIPVP